MSSMAAALATSLPAPSASALEKPVCKVIPVSLSNNLDIEAEIPLPPCYRLGDYFIACLTYHLLSSAFSSLVLIYLVLQESVAQTCQIVCLLCWRHEMYTHDFAALMVRLYHHSFHLIVTPLAILSSCTMLVAHVHYTNRVSFISGLMNLQSVPDAADPLVPPTGGGRSYVFLPGLIRPHIKPDTIV